MSFINTMEGAAIKAEREHDRSTTQAWNTAIFVLNGYAGKLKGKELSDYLIGREGPQHRSSLGRAVAFFHNMKAAGFPVEITRMASNSDDPPSPVVDSADNRASRP